MPQLHSVNHTNYRREGLILILIVIVILILNLTPYAFPSQDRAIKLLSTMSTPSTESPRFVFPPKAR